MKVKKNYFVSLLLGMLACIGGLVVAQVPEDENSEDTLYYQQELQNYVKKIMDDPRYQKDITTEEQRRQERLSKNSWEKLLEKWFKYKEKPRRQQQEAEFTPSSSGSTINSLLTLAIYLLGIIALTAAVGLIFYRSFGRLSMTNGQPQAHDAMMAAGQSPLSMAERDYEALARQGKILEACRALLASALQLLVAKKLIPSGRAFTNHEILGKLPAGALRQSLYQIACIIEKGYYARQPVTFEDYATCLQNWKSIQAAVGQA